jgi:glycosyltransferase involved in cell wall biosynthesis
MKIAIVTEWWYPVCGWGQVHVDYLSKILSKKYWYQVDIFTRKILWSDAEVFDKDEINDYGVRVFRVWPTAHFFNSIIRIVCLFTMTRYLYYKARKQRYDVIHAHALLPGIPAKIVGRLLNIPVVYTVHGMPLSDQWAWWLYPKLEQVLVCDIVYDLELSVSHNIFKYKNKNNNIKVLYNGVDLDKLNSIMAVDKYKPLTFLTVARMDKNKNHQIIIDAIIRIWVDYFIKNDIQFVWVGDWSEQESLKTKVLEHKLESVVIFRWKLEYDDAIMEFKRSHIFLLPSLGEWQPLTVLESFACTMPVIATDVGDNKYFIQNDVNGQLILPGDIQSLSDAILAFAEKTKDNIHHMWENWLRFVQDYTREHCVEKVVECYKKLIIKH